MISGFHFAKIYGYGVTFQTRASVIVQDTVIEDAAVGIYGLVAEPDASFHMGQDKFVTIKNSVISGRFYY